MVPLRGEPGGGVPLLGTLKNMLIRVLKRGVSLNRGPIVTMDGDLENGEILNYQGTLFNRNPRDMWKNAVQSGTSLLRVLVRKPGGWEFVCRTL